jgi:HSP20 family protein
MTMAEKSVTQGGRGEGRQPDPFNQLRGEMDRLFDSFMGGRGVLPRHLFEAGSLGGSLVVPQLEVRENEKAFVVSAELPGLEEKDIEVELHDGLLTIKGEKRIERKDDKENLHLTERRYGSFQRVLRLPDTIDEEKIAARFDRGVLRVDIPKRADAVRQPRKIQVSGNG